MNLPLSKTIEQRTMRLREKRTKGALTDREKIEETAAAAAKQKGIELLYDYTKFHISAYLTVAGAYLTAAFANVDNEPLLPLNLYLLCPAVVFTMIAGFAGGVIVSSLTQWQSGSTADFLESELGPWNSKWFKARKWTYLEHTSFWIGLIAGALSFFPCEFWQWFGIDFLGGGYR